MTALQGDIVLLNCPCCGVAGRLLKTELRWIDPLEAMGWLAAGVVFLGAGGEQAAGRDGPDGLTSRRG